MDGWMITQEQVVSAVGLLALLALAFAFSRDRSHVNPRTVAWGVGLQILFGVIILREGVASFGGIFLLVFLVVLYVFEKELAEKLGHPALIGVLTLALAGGLVWLFVGLAERDLAFVGLGGVNVTAALLGVSAVVWLLSLAIGPETFGGRLGRAGERMEEVMPSLRRFAFVAVLILGLSQLWAAGIDGRDAFGTASDKVAEFLALSNEGAYFLFGNLAVEEHFFVGDDAAWPGFAYQFAFLVLPTIIFFSAFMSVMYYLGVVQLIVEALARFMRWTLRTSGSETLSCSANVFVGQTEAPFLIKPFLKDMTASELHAVMVGGFATIAGGVLAAYIGMGVNPQHLIAASVMSAPAALVVAKLLYPETEESLTAGDVDIPEVKTAENVVEAAAEGTTDGLKLALNVGAMLIAFISLIAFLDWVLGYGDALVDHRWLGVAEQVNGEYRGYFPGSMQTIFGTLLAPLAFVMGVPWADAAAVGNLLGTKITINEFVAYGFLGELVKEGALQARSEVIATYALCGFANFSSIGIQIGGLSALEPSLRQTLSKIAVRALFGGALASFTTATVAGMLLT